MHPRLERSRCGGGWTLAATLAALLIAMQPSDAAAQFQVLVPAYFYPTSNSPWNELDAAARKIPLTAILNPDSGPGPSVNPDYVTAVNNLRAAGGHVVGYVYTNYGNRSEAAVEADIQSYISFYGSLNGFFLDQQSTDPAEVSYYADLYKYIKSLNPSYQVIANPGTNTSEAYLSTPTADVLVTFESAGQYYPGTAPASWTSHYSRNHFANIIYDVPTATAMQSDLQLAQQRNVGWIYVTDRTLTSPNGGPYGGLPSYWDQEVSQIAATAVPEPSSVWMLATGTLSLLGWRWKRKGGIIPV